MSPAAPNAATRTATSTTRPPPAPTPCMGRSSPTTRRWAARLESWDSRPRTQKVTPDGIGRYNQFAGTGGASIYWTPKTGAHEVQGAIRAHWSELSWERGILGYPITDERATRTPGGRYNNFQGGSMTWYPDRRHPRGQRRDQGPLAGARRRRRPARLPDHRRVLGRGRQAAAPSSTAPSPGWRPATR